jgi:flavin reductase (DIM6/NTAB) family NADH-FMN oxidoreductase RutF
MKILLEEKSSVLPVLPIVLVTSIGKNGKPNIITLGAVAHMSVKPPIIGIGIYPCRYSYGLIEETKDFVVNFPTIEMLWETDYIGTGPSGENIDKFEATGLTPLKSTKVKSPIIKECPLNLECILKQKLTIGSPDSHDWFIGEVVATHVDEEVMNEKGKIDLRKAPIIMYSGWSWEYWSIGKKLNDDAFSRKAPKPARKP